MSSNKAAKILERKGLLDVKRSFSGETFRGLLTSMFNSSLLAFLVYFCKTVLNLEVTTIAIVVNTILGNLTSYSLDILFAKKRFKVNEYKGKKYAKEDEEVEIPFTELATRFGWLIRSFFSNYFIKFLVVAVIDTSVYMIILDYMRKLFVKRNIKFTFGFIDQDILLLLVIPVVSFFLYVNQLRFKWAYSSNINPVMNMLMLLWFTTMLVLSFIYFKDDLEVDLNEVDEKIQQEDIKKKEEREAKKEAEEMEKKRKEREEKHHEELMKFYT